MLTNILIQKLESRSSLTLIVVHKFLFELDCVNSFIFEQNLEMIKKLGYHLKKS